MYILYILSLDFFNIFSCLKLIFSYFAQCFFTHVYVFPVETNLTTKKNFLLNKTVMFVL